LNNLLSSLSSSTEERLLEIVDVFTSFIPTSSQEQIDITVKPVANTSQTPTIVVLIWFHHLLSLTKRKAILALSSLRGVSKPGYPGVLVLQGHRDVVEDAIVELKGMKWQAMQVRGEIVWNDSTLEDGIHEVETVSEVVERMERLGLGDWCLSALRMK